MSPRLSAWEFLRVENRRTRSRRELYPGCGCIIGPREPYRYTVGKGRELAGLIQTYACDFHMRADSSY